jgi:DNA-directed RNA polymerase subunit M/transcription elongation factor TFIIS
MFETNQATRNTSISKCDSCGANLLFEPEKGALQCTHCESIRQIQARKSVQFPISALVENDQTWAQEATVVNCGNCGASEVMASGDISKICSFCGANKLAASSELPGLKPTAIMPFRLTKNQACASVKKWAKKKLFAPSKFKKSVVADEINGVYNPAFTFDASTVTPFNGVLEYDRTVTETYRDSQGQTRTCTRIVVERFNINGTYNQLFNEVTIQASQAISQKAVDGMMPFHTNDSAEYTEDFIRGFAASQYTKSGLQCFAEARSVMENAIRKAILGQYTYTRIVSFNMHPQFNNVQWKYVLLPVYVGHYTWKQKLFNFFVNGLTGKTWGKTPLSAVKLALAVLGGLAIVGGIVALVLLLGGYI